MSCVDLLLILLQIMLMLLLVITIHNLPTGRKDAALEDRQTLSLPVGEGPVPAAGGRDARIRVRGPEQDWGLGCGDGGGFW